jgi:glutamine amidotransferase
MKNMQNKIITIVDYGMGNLYSVYKALKRINIQSVITNDPKEIEKSEKLILPGVGHFQNGMENLGELGLIDILNTKVLKEKIPILGICLGMQLFGKYSEEGSTKGLGWIDADVIRFNINDKNKYRIPHMGWNTIELKKSSMLFDGLTNDDSFYFVHSYYLKCNVEEDILALTEYENEFVSAVLHENIMGTQFHPEKSHLKGMQILKNFAMRF